MTGQRPEADADAQPTTGLEDLESTAKLPVLDAATIESLEDEAELAHQRTTVLNPDTFHDAGTQPAIPILDVSPELLAGFEGRVVVRGESGAGAAAGRGDEAAHGEGRGDRSGRGGHGIRDKPRGRWFPIPCTARAWRSSDGQKLHDCSQLLPLHDQQHW